MSATRAARVSLSSSKTRAKPKASSSVILGSWRPFPTPGVGFGVHNEVRTAFDHVDHGGVILPAAMDTDVSLVESAWAAVDAGQARQARPKTDITHDAFLTVKDCKSPSTARISPLAA